MTVVIKRKDLNLDEIIGEPDELVRELTAYAEDAMIFSSEREHLIAKYEKQWVGVYGGAVRASARQLSTLLRRLDQQDIPRGRAIVRYIDRNERTMIL